MQKNKIIPGRILHVSGKKVYISQAHRLLKSSDGGESWKKWVQLPVSMSNRILMRFRLPARLFRLGVHHLDLCNGLAIGIVNKEFFAVNNNIQRLLGSVNGSRPMALCASDSGGIYYGEYRSNPERKKINIWSFDKLKNKWVSVWCFDNIRHVHGVFSDPYTSNLWITTGDEDHESAIWMTQDRFKTLKKIVGGTQQCRTIKLLFTKDHVYFGSDAPDEKNYIYRMDRQGKQIEKLIAVGGSVFHGCKVGDHLFFSTAVESSKVNLSKYAEVWGSDDGINWQMVIRFKKDIWSMKYFQYGQVFFPAGLGDDNYLWFTPMGTESDQMTFKLPIASVFSSFVL